MDAYFAKPLKKEYPHLHNLPYGTTFIFADMIDKEPDVWMAVDEQCGKDLTACVRISTGGVEYWPDETPVIKVKPAEPRVRFIPDV